MLAGNNGVIVGTLFDRITHEQLDVLNRGATNTVWAAAGESLFTGFWGAFFGVIADCDITHILRDPSGAIPVYWKETADNYIISSDPFGFDLNDELPDIDWISVAGHLYYPERRSRQTCLVGWQELIPGERLSLADSGATLSVLWSPWRFTRSAVMISDATEAADLVGRAVRSTVSGWNRRYERPLVSISGGLDSSVLVAALSKPPAACITISTDEPGGDERPYARLVAKRAGAPMIERFFEPQRINLWHSNAARLPRPVSRCFAQEFDRHWRETSVEVDADALFHGGGGDNVFCYLTSPAPVLDSALLRGLGIETWRVADDVGRLNEASISKVMSMSLRKAVIDRGRYRWRVDPELLSSKAIRMGGQIPTHPWFEKRLAGVVPGKQAHVAGIVRIQNYLDAIAPSQIKPVVAPLLSQPVIEACLRVPSWLWCDGGINRAVARSAFARDLSPAITNRVDKGTPGSFSASIIADHRGEILNYLKRGQLAKRGMLDISGLGAALSSEGPLRGNAFLRISELIDVEAWLQSWGDTAATRTDMRGSTAQA